MNDQIEKIEEEASEGENADHISGVAPDGCSRAMDLDQIDDSELPQSVKDCLKVETER